MCVQRADPLGLGLRKHKLLPVFAKPVCSRRGKHFVRIYVLWKLFPCLGQIGVVCRLDRLIKSRHGMDADVFRLQIAEEAGVDVRPVFISDLNPAGNGRAGGGGGGGGGGEQRQRRREQEKPDAALRVPCHDLRQNRKRRIVDDHRVRRIVKCLVISARPERAHEARALDAILYGHEVRDRVINRLRRIAVVGGLFRFEFVDEGLILRRFLVKSFRKRRLTGFLVVCAFSALISLYGYRFAWLVLCCLFQQPEVEAFKIKAVQLDLQQLRVPLGDLAGFVVQDAVLPLLRFAEALDLADLRLVPAQLLQSLVSGVPGQDHACFVDDDGRAVPALPNTLRHCVHGAVVPPGIAFIRLDFFKRQRLQLQAVVLPEFRFAPAALAVRLAVRRRVVCVRVPPRRLQPRPVSKPRTCACALARTKRPRGRNPTGPAGQIAPSIFLTPRRFSFLRRKAQLPVKPMFATNGTIP